MTPRRSRAGGGVLGACPGDVPALPFSVWASTSSQVIDTLRGCLGTGTSIGGRQMVAQWVRAEAPCPTPLAVGLDAALRHLVHACRAGRRPLPGLPVAVVREDLGESGTRGLRAAGRVPFAGVGRVPSAGVERSARLVPPADASFADVSLADVSLADVSSEGTSAARASAAGGLAASGDVVVELTLSAPAGEPPPPWEACGGRWRCRVEALGDVPAAPPAYPALVPVGRSLHDAGVVWVDLGSAPGLVTIEGAPDEIRALLAGIRESLGRMPWSRQVRVWEIDDLADVRRRDDRLAEAFTPLPVLGGVDGRWGPPPRGSHDVVLLSSPATPSLRATVRATSRRRNAPTVLAPVRPGEAAARGVWNWRLEGGRVTW